MESVYQASSGFEAYLIKDLLERAGIAARVDGEYLQGGIGELPPMGFARVSVDAADAREAREIIAEWEQGLLAE